MSIAEQPDTAETLRQKMSQVRNDLDHAVGEVIENARELTDWRHYVREYPFACVGAALAVGFVIVPQKIRVMSPTSDQLEQLAKRDHLIVKPSKTAGPPTPGWKRKALTMGANLLFRAALTYLGQQAGKMVGEQAAQES